MSPDPEAVSDRDTESSPVWSRRDVLRRAGIAGAFAVGGGVLGHEFLLHGGTHAAAADAQQAAYDGSTPSSAQSAGTAGTAVGVYGHAAGPPVSLAAGDLDAVTFPPAPDGHHGVARDVELPVTQRQVEVGDGAIVDAWTYGGMVPGPIIRATAGDRLRVHLTNHTSHPHNVHLHGRHDPGMDGWEPIPPGEAFTYELVAEPFGLHPYHCHVVPIAEHISRGLYGAVIVDPPGGRPPAHEVVLVLGGWDLDGAGRNGLVVFNGIAGAYDRFPIRVPVGELVRVYLLNMLAYEPVASFHLHAQTFDVIRSGTSLEPDEHTDIVALTQGERAILEFRLPVQGRYMFHPHQSHLAERGAMGWFAAV
ncbi:MAG: multicopper oxidase domain-containing protein [Nitriliruptoraceae bacterium]